MLLHVTLWPMTFNLGVVGSIPTGLTRYSDDLDATLPSVSKLGALTEAREPFGERDSEAA